MDDSCGLQKIPIRSQIVHMINTGILRENVSVSSPLQHLAQVQQITVRERLREQRYNSIRHATLFLTHILSL